MGGESIRRQDSPVLAWACDRWHAPSSSCASLGGRGQVPRHAGRRVSATSCMFIGRSRNVLGGLALCCNIGSGISSSGGRIVGRARSAGSRTVSKQVPACGGIRAGLSAGVIVWCPDYTESQYPAANQPRSISAKPGESSRWLQRPVARRCGCHSSGGAGLFD